MFLLVAAVLAVNIALAVPMFRYDNMMVWSSTGALSALVETYFLHRAGNGLWVVALIAAIVATVAGVIGYLKRKNPLHVISWAVGVFGTLIAWALTLTVEVNVQEVHVPVGAFAVIAGGGVAAAAYLIHQAQNESP